ncbi:MAG: hypothetical protein Q9205_007864 [Flavoplaca limonia]
MNRRRIGDDPPRGTVFYTISLLPNSENTDRTSELRKKGFTGRRLGPIQMTTDTAVRVTRMVIQGQALDAIPYLDYPEIRIDEHESTEMPFRYVTAADGKPAMPEVSAAPHHHFGFRKDSEKGFGDLL